MVKKVIDNEPMLEEAYDEVLLEETSGKEAMLEETSDSEMLLEEDPSESVLLEEDSEVLLEEATDKAAAITAILGSVKQKAEEKAADEERYKVARERSRKETDAEREDNNQQKKLEEEKQNNIQIVVDYLIEDLVGGFEIIQLFSKNKPYRVCGHLITQEIWWTIMGDNQSSEKNSAFPVTNITLNEAEIFVQRVNRVAKLRGVEFMIPTPEMQRFGFQKEVVKVLKEKRRFETYCWFDGNSKGKLHPVGALESVVGIYDACGLVYEWITMKNYSLLTGGSINDTEKHLLLSETSSLRYRDQSYNDVGLRLVAMG